jgi:Multiubiquitin
MTTWNREGRFRAVTVLTEPFVADGVVWRPIEVFPMETQVKLYHFFVGGNRFETDKPTLTATQIKALAGVNPDHQLFFRDDVNTPDRLIRDTQAVALIPPAVEDGTVDRAVEDSEPLELDEVHQYHGHFYAVPNSSYRRLKSNP